MGGGKTGSQFSVHHALSVKVTDYARKVRHLQEICKGRREDFCLLSLNDNSPGLTTDGQMHPSPRALSSPLYNGRERIERSHIQPFPMLREMSRQVRHDRYTVHLLSNHSFLVYTIDVSVMLSGAQRSRNISFLRCQTDRELREILRLRFNPLFAPPFVGGEQRSE